MNEPILCIDESVRHQLITGGADNKISFSVQDPSTSDVKHSDHIELKSPGMIMMTFLIAFDCTLTNFLFIFQFGKC
jgi:hypothetical protein